MVTKVRARAATVRVATVSDHRSGTGVCLAMSPASALSNTANRMAAKMSSTTPETSQRK
jgi:hypothetical protein